MIKNTIAKLVAGLSLTEDEAVLVMEEIMEGKATPAQLGAFLTALKVKGVTATEITGLANVIRAKATKVNIDKPVIDIVGTGGDKADTFNISTTVAFVVAGVGLSVAKHGNRAASSRCGSADVLEALGIKIDMDALQVGRCINEIGIGFMFAQAFHPAMKYAAVPRREIGIPTVFNILGPLANPAGVKHMILGVADKTLLEKIAMALKNLGCARAMVVRGEDGLDEITNSTKTEVYEVADGTIKHYLIAPEDFGLPHAHPDELKGGTAIENAELLRGILAGSTGPKRNIVLMNAAAALFVAGKVSGLKDGVRLAEEAIDNRSAAVKLEQLIQFSRNLETIR